VDLAPPFSKVDGLERLDKLRPSLLQLTVFINLGLIASHLSTRPVHLIHLFHQLVVSLDDIRSGCADFVDNLLAGSIHRMSVQDVVKLSDVFGGPVENDVIYSVATTDTSAFIAIVSGVRYQMHSSHMLLITDKIFISFSTLSTFGKVVQNPFYIVLAPPLLKVDYIVLLHLY
jgi:hypothetical protein